MTAAAARAPHPRSTRSTGSTSTARWISITQCTSIATNPALHEHVRCSFGSLANVPPCRPGLGRYAGQRHRPQARAALAGWSDVASGDGGQVLVDPTNANYVYGTYFGVSPYRWTDQGNSPAVGTSFFTNQSITRGINTERPVRLLHPVGAEQGEPEPAVPGHLPGYIARTTPRPRRRATCSGTRSAGPHERMHRHSAQRRAHVRHLGVRARWRAGRLRRLARRLRLGQPGRTGRRTHRTGPGSTRSKLPNRPVQSIAVDRSNYRIAYLCVRRLLEVDARPLGSCLQDAPTVAAA